MNQNDKKAAVAKAALDYVTPGTVIGVGTGSTANFFIHALADTGIKIAGAVASSEATAKRLRDHGITVTDLNEADTVAVYIDGADEATACRQLIKGGGGALTREKIVAAVARQFVCIVDDSKLVHRLGRFPLPVEVLAPARNYVARQLLALHGRPEWRRGFVTDNGHCIVDVHDLDMPDPADLESRLNQVTGTVANGLFARRSADVLLVADDHGVKVL